MDYAFQLLVALDNTNGIGMRFMWNGNHRIQLMPKHLTLQGHILQSMSMDIFVGLNGSEAFKHGFHIGYHANIGFTFFGGIELIQCDCTY